MACRGEDQEPEEGVVRSLAERKAISETPKLSSVESSSSSVTPSAQAPPTPAGPPVAYIVLNSEFDLVQRCIPLDKIDSALMASLGRLAADAESAERHKESAWQIFQTSEWRKLSDATTKSRFGSALSDNSWGQLTLTDNDSLFIICDEDIDV